MSNVLGLLLLVNMKDAAPPQKERFQRTRDHGAQRDKDELSGAGTVVHSPAAAQQH